MPLHLELEKRFQSRSERVKCVDVHPTEPWVLASLYTGQLLVYDYHTGAVMKQFDVSDQPLRAAKFVVRKQWIVVVADDLYMRVYNYNTLEKVREVEVHQDYVRSVAVHPTRPLVLTASDDMLIKLWDWEKSWTCVMVYEGHSHYVMQVAFNPKDPSTFASASLDRTVRIWSLASPVPNLTLEGHEKGVNCVDYYPGGDRPYLVSGADDCTVIIWDIQTKTPVQQLHGHSGNISAVAFHPSRPIVFSGSEDGTVRLWNSNTYRLENTLSYGLDRCWSVACSRASNLIALGFDMGAVVVKLGRDEPVVSMDASGKVVLSRHNAIQSAVLRQMGGEVTPDGERLSVVFKDLGSSDTYPQQLAHSPNGRFVSVCGDGEFTIYTALAWRNKSFGQGDELAWDNTQGDYAVREGTARVRVFAKTHAERSVMRTPFAARHVFGGTLLGVAGDECVCFYDWATLRIVQRVDVAARQVLWSDSVPLVAVTAADSLYILAYDAAAVEAHLQAPARPGTDEGIEGSFAVLHEFGEQVQSGRWHGECFFFTSTAGRIGYVIGGEVALLAHADRPLYVLGYLPSENRLFLIDREHRIVAYTLLPAVMQFKALVNRGEQAAALSLLPSIPPAEHNRLARALEARGQRELAFEIATDPEYRFDMAVALGRLDEALPLVEAAPSEAKWRQLVDLALAANDLALAERCMREAHDLSSLVLLCCAQGNAKGMQQVGEMARRAGQLNVAFLGAYLNRDVDACIDLLLGAERLPEAALLARTYAPSRVPALVSAWKKWLRSRGDVRTADRLGDPEAQPELFPGYTEALTREAQVREGISSAEAAAGEMAPPPAVPEAPRGPAVAEAPQPNGAESEPLAVDLDAELDDWGEDEQVEFDAETSARE